MEHIILYEGLLGYLVFPYFYIIDILLRNTKSLWGEGRGFRPSDTLKVKFKSTFGELGRISKTFRVGGEFFRRPLDFYKYMAVQVH